MGRYLLSSYVFGKFEIQQVVVMFKRLATLGLPPQVENTCGGGK
jgi:hypothetical protein